MSRDLQPIGLPWRWSGFSNFHRSAGLQQIQVYKSEATFTGLGLGLISIAASCSSHLFFFWGVSGVESGVDGRWLGCGACCWLEISITFQTLWNPPVLSPRPVKTVVDRWWSNCPGKKSCREPLYGEFNVKQILKSCRTSKTRIFHMVSGPPARKRSKCFHVLCLLSETSCHFLGSICLNNIVWIFFFFQEIMHSVISVYV